jgi:hypothetical protein
MKKYIVGILVLLSLPFVIPGIMGERMGYAYGWLPGYSVCVAMYYKHSGVELYFTAVTLPPGDIRDGIYMDALDRLKFARSSYFLHMKALPFWSWIGEEYLECHKMIYASYKMKRAWN